MSAFPGEPTQDIRLPQHARWPKSAVRVFVRQVEQDRVRLPEHEAVVFEHWHFKVRVSCRVFVRWSPLPKSTSSISQSICRWFRSAMTASAREDGGNTKSFIDEILTVAAFGSRSRKWQARFSAGQFQGRRNTRPSGGAT